MTELNTKQQMISQAYGIYLKEDTSFSKQNEQKGGEE